MLFKIEVKDSEGQSLDTYFVEASSLKEGSEKAKAQAEDDYPTAKPVTVTHIETLSWSDVVR